MLTSPQMHAVSDIVKQNGVRGSSHFLPSPANCLPCGTAMGATFDADLIKVAACVLARDAKAKGSSLLLAPTVNIPRNPLNGRVSCLGSLLACIDTNLLNLSCFSSSDVRDFLRGSFSVWNVGVGLCQRATRRGRWCSHETLW
jgi:hypothetical protein